MALFYFGRSRFFLPRMIGSFVVVLAIVMFVVSAGSMFDSWDAMKKYPNCLARIETGTSQIAMLQYLDCKDSLFRITGLQLRPDEPRITVRQFVITLFRPVADLLFWAAAFLFGLFLYNTRIVRHLPLSQVGKPPAAGKKRKRRKRV